MPRTARAVVLGSMMLAVATGCGAAKRMPHATTAASAEGVAAAIKARLTKAKLARCEAIARCRAFLRSRQRPRQQLVQRVIGEVIYSAIPDNQAGKVSRREFNNIIALASGRPKV